MNMESQNPHEIQDIALQALEEYKAELEEDEREERRRSKTKTKKVRRLLLPSWLLFCGGRRGG